MGHTVHAVLGGPAWYPSLVGSGTSQSTQAHQARVPSWVNWVDGLMALFHFYLPSVVPELDGLGYFTKYPSPPRSSTKLGKLDSWAYMALFHFYLPSLVPELDALGYFVKYSSPPSSGTKLGHQVPHGLCGPLNY